MEAAELFGGCTDAQTMNPTSWIEIDLDRLDANLAAFKGAIGPSSSICAVTKADAYGLCAVPIASRLDARGVGMLAVFSMDQAHHLLSQNLKSPILAMLRTERIPHDPVIRAGLAQGRLHLALHDADQFACLQDAGRELGLRIPIHLYVDTGMARAGLHLQCVPNIISQSLGNAFIKLSGIYTHMACAETDPDFTRIQAYRFDEALAPYTDVLHKTVTIHMANTAAALLDPSLHRDMVRVGLGLYGYDPTDHAQKRAGARLTLKPILRWRSRIVHTQAYPAHTTVGYNATWKLSRASTLAVVPVGYADGYALSLSNRGVVEFPELIAAGHPGTAPVVGRVNMDQIVIDITDLPTVARGTMVQLISDQTDSACALPKLARLAESSCYELLCRISHRVHRKYTGKPIPAPEIHIPANTEKLIPRPSAKTPGGTL
jgi:alanine racemase